MDQFLISQTPDSLNKSCIVGDRNGGRLYLQECLFFGGAIGKFPPRSLLLERIDQIISHLKWQRLIHLLISWEIYGSV